MKKMSLMDQFINEISKIKEVEVFFGIARILKVSLFDEDKEAKEFNVVFADVLESFKRQKKKRQKEIVSVLRDANEYEEVVPNGNSSENTAEAVSDKEMR